MVLMDMSSMNASVSCTICSTLFAIIFASSAAPVRLRDLSILVHIVQFHIVCVSCAVSQTRDCFGLGCEDQFR